MLKTIHLWMYKPEEGHDKTYSLSMMSTSGDKYDVVAQFGKRGCEQKFFVWLEGVSEQMAYNKFGHLRREKLNKGYKEVPSLENLKVA